MMRRRGGWAAAGCAALILLVGATRVYLDRHWMTDVVGAWMLAGTALALAGSARAKPR
jgi:membrane-associated phospholipid phosphatase